MGCAFARIDRAEDGTITVGELLGVPLSPSAFQEGPLGGPLTEPRLFREPLDELLEQASGDIDRASLVLPDRWLRLVLADGTDLPRRAADRDEAILWKLRNLVPFRIEDLRVRSRVAGHGDRRRALIAFAIDQLLGQLEVQFASAGVQIGRITCESLALRAALAHSPNRDGKDRFAGLSAQVLARPDGYTLLFLDNGEPLLYRYKVADPSAGVDVSAALARRELALTLRYLEEEVPDLPLTSARVAAEGDAMDTWLGCLREGLGVEPEAITSDQVPGGSSVASPWAMPWHEMAPMVGAAVEEVV